MWRKYYNLYMTKISIKNNSFVYLNWLFKNTHLSAMIHFQGFPNNACFIGMNQNESELHLGGFSYTHRLEAGTFPGGGNHPSWTHRNKDIQQYFLHENNLKSFTWCWWWTPSSQRIYFWSSLTSLKLESTIKDSRKKKKSDLLQNNICEW